MKKISIIIVTYNSQPYIKKCLDSIFEYNTVGELLEVIVVDNSTEKIAAQLFEMIQEYYPDQIKFIKNDSNRGYGHGNNLGIKAAQGKYIAIMNPDITMTESLFQDVIQRFESNSKMGIIGYKQKGGLDLSFYFRPEYYIPLLTPLLTKICNKMGWFNQKYMFLSGAFFFTTKACFEKIGNFDEALFLYCEESDITNRFVKSGFSIHYDDSKSYIHEIEGREEMSPTGFNYFLNSSLYYLNKFSYSREKFLCKLEIELKFKKMYYSILNNSKSKEVIEDQLEQINTYKKNI